MHREIDFPFDKEFDTYIIVYCPDTREWLVTNNRAFWYEYPDREFISENEGIEYFNKNVNLFLKLEKEFMESLGQKTDFNSIFLTNINKKVFI